MKHNGRHRHTGRLISRQLQQLRIHERNGYKRKRYIKQLLQVGICLQGWRYSAEAKYHWPKVVDTCLVFTSGRSFSNSERAKHTLHGKTRVCLYVTVSYCHSCKRLFPLHNFIVRDCRCERSAVAINSEVCAWAPKKVCGGAMPPTGFWNFLLSFQ